MAGRGCALCLVVSVVGHEEGSFQGIWPSVETWVYAPPSWPLGMSGLTKQESARLIWQGVKARQRSRTKTLFLDTT